MLKQLLKILILLNLLTVSIFSFASQSEWQNFSPPKAGFTVKMPGTPEESISGQGGDKSYNYILNTKDKGSYTISYFDANIHESNLPLPKEVIDNLISITKESVIAIENSKILTAPRGSVINEFPVSIAGFPGKGVLFKTGKGNIYNSRIYVVNKRVYVLLCTRAGESNYKQFFNSFVLK